MDSHSVLHHLAVAFPEDSEDPWVHSSPYRLFQDATPLMMFKFDPRKDQHRLGYGYGPSFSSKISHHQQST